MFSPFHLVLKETTQMQVAIQSSCQLILFISDIFYSDVSSLNFVVIPGRMTSDDDDDELERIWKEGVTAKL